MVSWHESGKPSDWNKWDGRLAAVVAEAQQLRRQIAKEISDVQWRNELLKRWEQQEQDTQ